MQQDAKRYSRLAQQYGVSGAAIGAANTFARAICHVKNKAYGSNWLRGKVADKAERKGHIRERAINMLRQKHPDKYKVT